MVLQVLADARRVVNDIDAGRREHRSGADARELQELWRADRTGAQDDLLAGADLMHGSAALVGDAGRRPAGEGDAMDQRFRDQRQVRPAERRLEIGVGRRPAHAVLDGHVHRPEALLLEAVVILGLQIAGLDTGLDEGAVERVEPHVVAVVGRQRPVAAPVVVVAGAPGLGAAEIGQAIAVAPVGGAALLPLVKVAGVAAHIDHAVDRRRAADHLAARAVKPAAVHMGFWLGLELPVVALHVHRDRQRGRHLDEDAAVAAAGLEHEDAARRVLGEAVGEHAAGRPGADDYVVELFHMPDPSTLQ